MSDEEATRLIGEMVMPDNGMPPFPGIDLFDPADFAFWYGGGTGHRLDRPLDLVPVPVEPAS